MRFEILNPKDIEAESFRRIDAELKHRGITLSADTAPVVRRVIHTTADFDYVENLFFSEDACGRLHTALSKGAHIVTDTQMAKAGISEKTLIRYGGRAHCYMNDPDVSKEASVRGVTRAAVSMERAAAEFAVTKEAAAIFAVGNAPTALLRLHELITATAFRPAGIIAVPVGFVNVVEAKEQILSLQTSGYEDIPLIVARGQKGGSNVAAAIVNALLYSIREA